MSFIEIFFIALCLSMDCLAVSVSFGLRKNLVWRDILKLAFFFGLFQGVMPVIGWLAGSSVQNVASAVDHWIAFGILSFIGLRMIYESFRGIDEKKSVDIRSWKILLSLSFATSIDALITGVSMGFIKVNILVAVVTFAVVTFLISMAGAYAGLKSIRISPRWAEITGGTVLIGIGLKIVLEHLAII